MEGNEVLTTSLLVKHAEIARLLPLFLLPKNDEEEMFQRYRSLAREGLVESQKKSKWKTTTFRAFSRTYRNQVNMVEKLDMSFLEIFGGGFAGTRLAAFVEDRLGDKDKASILRNSAIPDSEEGVLMSVQAFLDAVSARCDNILIPGTPAILLSPQHTWGTHLFMDLVLDVLKFLSQVVVSEVALLSTPVEEWSDEDLERVKKAVEGWDEDEVPSPRLEDVNRKEMQEKVKERVENSIFPGIYDHVEQLKGSMGRLEDLDGLISQASTLQNIKGGRRGSATGGSQIEDSTMFEQVANSVINSSQKALGGSQIAKETETKPKSSKKKRKGSSASTMLEPPGMSAPTSTTYDGPLTSEGSCISSSITSVTSVTSPRKTSSKKKKEKSGRRGSTSKRRGSHSTSPMMNASANDMYPEPPLLPSSSMEPLTDGEPFHSSIANTPISLSVDAPLPLDSPSRASSLLSAPLPCPLFVSPRDNTPPPSPIRQRSALSPRIRSPGTSSRPKSTPPSPPPLNLHNPPPTPPPMGSPPSSPPTSPLSSPHSSPPSSIPTSPPTSPFNTPTSPPLPPPLSPKNSKGSPLPSPLLSPKGSGLRVVKLPPAQSFPPPSPTTSPSPPSTPPLPSTPPPHATQTAGLAAPPSIALPSSTPVQERRKVSPLERVLDELVVTEESYVLGLQELINSYFMPLSLSKTIGPAEISQIFVNSARVLEIHKGILKELKAHGGSKRIQLICKTLGDNVPLKLAYRVFISGFDLATELIEQLDSTNKEFSAALGDCSSQAKKGTWVGKLGLLSLLITPVQRLPRYKLLFSQLVKEMKGEHPDKAEVLATVKKIDRTIIEINHAKRAHQQQMNLGSLMTKIKGNEIAVMTSMAALPKFRTPHKFKKVVTRNAVTCAHCDHIIYSSMSMVLQCVNCQCYAHEACEKWFPEACGTVAQRESYLVQPKRKLLHHESVVFTIWSQAPIQGALFWNETERVEGLLLIFNDSLLFSEKTGAERYELRFVMKWESNATLSLAEIALKEKDGEMVEKDFSREKSDLLNPFATSSTASKSSFERRLLIVPPRIKKGIYCFTKCNTGQIHELVNEQLELIRSEKNLTGHLKRDFKLLATPGRFLSFEGWVWLSTKRRSRFYWCTLYNDRLVLQRSYDSRPDKIINLDSGSVCVAATGEKKTGEGGGMLQSLLKEMGGTQGLSCKDGSEDNNSPSTRQARRKSYIDGVFSLGTEVTGFKEEDGWEFTVYQTSTEKEQMSLFAPTENELKYWVHHISFNVSILQKEVKEEKEEGKEKEKE